MRFLKWAGLAAAFSLVGSCFFPWVIIASKQLVISGIDATGTNYGKPGYFNILMAVFFILFMIIPRIWAKRANLLIVALNLAWAVRNYFILSTCQAGECPEKQGGLYLLVFSALVMLVAALFPDMKIERKEPA
jgi:hypothetical protein